MPSEERKQVRRQLIEGHPEAWIQLLTKHRLRPQANLLQLLGRWITPPYFPTAFDALYYSLWLPQGESAEIWPGELTEGMWLSCAEALAGHEKGELFIAYPVLETLKVMHTHGGNLKLASKELVLRTTDGHAYHAQGGELITGVHCGSPAHLHPSPRNPHQQLRAGG